MIQINRVRFLAAVGAPGWPILKLRQVHSGIVRDMRDTLAAGDAIEGDAAITGLNGALLGVQTADCVPILIAESNARCVAAIHAGWRGTAARISMKTVVELKEKYQARTEDLVAVIGPHIGLCCYEVGPEVVAAIADPASFEQRPEWPRPHLNLGEANRRQLIESGLSEDRIVVTSLCTRCRGDLLFSYRREGEKAGRLLAVIGIAP